MKKIWKKLPLKIKYLLFFMLGVGCTAIGSMSSCSVFKYYPEDNIFEELVEDIIEDEFGHAIDLSPFSPEA